MKIIAKKVNAGPQFKKVCKFWHIQASLQEINVIRCKIILKTFQLLFSKRSFDKLIYQQINTFCFRDQLV